MEDSQNSLYERITSHKKKAIIIIILLILVSLIINIFVGSAELTIKETIKSILFLSDNINHVIVWEIRMPVALAAIIIGAALGIGGCEMQTILNNPMASPYTLGISSAASFGAALGIILGFGIIPIEGADVVLNAFLFAMIAIFSLYHLSKRFEWDKTVIILFGIALNFLFQALTMFLQFIASEDELQSFVYWSFGDLTKINYQQIIFLAILTIFVLVRFLKKSWQLTALSLGDISASSLGVDTNKLRRTSIVYIALLSATCVSFAGTIGFVGIVAPHIARMISGDEQRYFLILSALMGSMILSIASIFSKIIVPGTLLPIGLVTSLVGIPLFIYLIFRNGGKVL